MAFKNHTDVNNAYFGRSYDIEVYVRSGISKIAKSKIIINQNP